MDENYFLSDIQHNYQIAKSYYRQKREMLNGIFRKDKTELFAEIEKYINKLIEEYQETVVRKVFESLNFENGFYSVKSNLPNMEYNVSVDRVLKQIGNRSLMRRNISSFLGIEFEKFLERGLAPQELSQAVSSEATEIVNSLLGGFSRTGDQLSTSAVVKGSKDIRPDLGLGMSLSVDSSGKLDINDSGLGVELQALIDLSELEIAEEEITSSDILKSYLNTNAFGFSAKLWRDGNNKEFSSSSVLQEMINNQLITHGPDGNRTTWESYYTEAYVVYQLSKYLINIISPTNVAMITGNNFIWMDAYISNKIFFMNVQLEEMAKKSNRGSGYEGFPSITDPAIRIRQLNNEQQIFKTRVSKSGKISIINRTIKKQ